MTQQPGSERKALIAGGGIGGTAVSLALARAGWAVSVHERAAEIREVGAGLQMSPNACRVLRWLGVLEAVVERAFAPQAAQMRDGYTGAVIYQAALASAAEERWGAPYLHVHRADLLDVLLTAARAAGVDFNTGDAVESYTRRPEGARLRMADGRTETAQLVIGADGLRSALRAVLNGEEEPQFSGQIAWRATVPADRIAPELVAPNATVWAGPGRHLVTYYLRGGTLVNIAAVEERPDWTAEDWTVAGDPDLLRAAFTGWHDQVTGLLAAVDTAFVWGLYQRPEQVRWTDGPVALLGDAAHPMLPFMAQGAAMALEDVAVLMRALDEEPEVPAALLLYEERRWSRVARVQAQSRSNGHLFHKKTEFGRLVSWAPISAVARMAPGFAAGRLDWLYGHDATAGL